MQIEALARVVSELGVKGSPADARHGVFGDADFVRRSRRARYAAR